LTYRQPVNAPYSLSLTTKGMAFEARCPMVASGIPGLGGVPPGILRCDTNGVELSGVDLGHDSNETLAVGVTIDGAPMIAVSATLAGIKNSRDCDLICFAHVGTVAN
jgi:hypothetical protein